MRENLLGDVISATSEVNAGFLKLIELAYLAGWYDENFGESLRHLNSLAKILNRNALILVENVIEEVTE
jgi:hypothetical protein